MNIQSQLNFVQNKKHAPCPSLYLNKSDNIKTSTWSGFSLLLLRLCHLQGMQTHVVVGHNKSLQYTTQGRPLAPLTPSPKELWQKFFKCYNTHNTVEKTWGRLKKYIFLALVPSPGISSLPLPPPNAWMSINIWDISQFLFGLR